MDKPQNSSQHGSDRRERLIDAGWELFRELPLSGVFAGLTTAKVAAAAGVTTGSFFHHFPNAAAFADALVLQHADLTVAYSASVDEVAEISEYWNLDVSAVVHHFTTEIWQSHLQGGKYASDLARVLTLWAHRDAELHRPTDRYETAGDVVQDAIHARERLAISAWRDLIDSSNMEISRGYSIATIAMVLTALFDGLAIRHAVDPDSVSETIYADIAWIIANALTVPKQMEIITDRSILPSDGTGYLDRGSSNLSPQAQSGARRRNESKAQVLKHCSNMFENGWESITITDIAHRAKVSAQTVINVFGTVRRVAAISFVQHLGKVSVAASTAALSSPEAELLAILESIAESASRDPGAARALLGERIILNIRPQLANQGLDVRTEVPFDRLIIRPLADLGINGSDAAPTADMLINFVLSHAPGRADDARCTAQLAMRLIDPAPPTHSD